MLMSAIGPGCVGPKAGPGMSALTPLLGLGRRERLSLCFHYTRENASFTRSMQGRTLRTDPNSCLSCPAADSTCKPLW